MNEYYSIADLENRQLLDKGSDMPARLAVIGFPIKQSKSPQMQQAALDSLGKKVRYIRLEIKPEDFKQAIRQLIDLEFIGVNITAPHKSAAACICMEKDALATKTNAVNTIVFPPTNEGVMKGFNTDGPGFHKAVKETFGVDLKDLKIAILGACGGAGTTLAHTCAMNKCEQLVLVNRPNPKLRELQHSLSPLFVDERRLEGASDRLRSYEFGNHSLEKAISEVDLIVNATSLGLNPADPSPIPGSFIQPYHLVYDILTHNTSLQQEANNQGARVSNGLSMLIHQGAIAFTCWFGETPDVSLMKKALGF